MSWVDKINGWALKRVGRQAIERVDADAEGTTLIRADSTEYIRWSDIQEIAIVKQPPFASGSFALAIRGNGSRLAIVDDTASGYAELCQQLSQRLEGVVPIQQWAVQLIAKPERTGAVIFRRRQA